MRRQQYVHGWADYLAGRGFLDNPYVQDSDDFRIWIDGFVDCLIAQRRPVSEGEKRGS